MKKNVVIGIVVGVLVLAIAFFLLMPPRVDMYTSSPTPEEVSELFDDDGICLDDRALFATEAEALDHAEKIGCTGSHMHSEYADPYMACEDHQQLVDMDAVC